MNMGSQFWWFYDVAAAAVILVAVFITARKPISKSAASLAAFLLGIVVAASASGTIGESVYKNAIKNSNAEKLEKTLDDGYMVQKTKLYIESLGYNVNVKAENVEKIFSECASVPGKNVYDELYSYVNNINGKNVDTEEAFRAKMEVGFASIIKSIVSERLSGYAAECAYKKVLEKPDSIGELIAFSQEEYQTAAAKYIESQYTSGAYITTVKLISFILLAIAVIIIVKLFAHALFSGRSDYAQPSLGEHIGGAVIGLAVGAAALVIIAVSVKIYTIFGSGEMLFFNDEVIDKTIIFKYAYELAGKL